MRRPSLTAALAALGLCLAALLSCTKPRTQIIVLVDTDMAQGPGATLTHVRITVKNPATGSIRQRLTYPLRQTIDGQTFELPATLGVAALDNDGARSVEVNVDAVSDPGGDGTARGPMFTYYAIAPFEEERTKLLSVFLADRCRVLARDCRPDETCGLNGCVPRTVTGLPDVSPDFTPEAGARDAPDDLADAPSVLSDARGDLLDASTDLSSDLADAPVDLADVLADVLPDVSADLADAPSDLLDVAPTDAPCPAGQSRCGAGCVDTTGDPRHCGACSNACTAGANTIATCTSGRCGLACVTGFGDCDGAPANGCETDLATDARHCGRCAAACSVNRATPQCRAGTCRLTCAAGFGDCDGDVANGCEGALGTPTQCSACGSACRLPSVATQACVAGACAVGSCAAGRGNCDGVALNGCEVDTLNDGAHCGACGRACATGQVCNAGVCGRVCSTGLTACGSICVDLSTSAANCGACANACPARANAAPSCASGRCGATCNAGFADCDLNPANGCEASLAATATCGACGRVCSAANATPTCASGACGFVCSGAFGDCDGAAANGCETDTRSSGAHCGRCDRPCSLPRATAVCAVSACAIGACEAGWASCDGNDANGCEVDTRSSAASCGGCGRACALANARSTCSSSTCQVAVCSAGFANCNSVHADGCEVNVNADNVNCGACGVRCPALTACAGGACVSTCPAATPRLCSGVCVDVLTNADHCGACSNACAPRANTTRTCLGGSCRYACLDGWGDCNGLASDGCEAPLTTPTNCGACAVTCALPNATAECSTRSCLIARCDASWANCNRSTLDGCETRVDNDVFNCGGCGASCPARPHATPRCASGACELVCDPGWEDCDRNRVNGCELEVGARCGDGCAPGVTSCAASTPTCVTTPLRCGAPCTQTGVMGFCDLAGSCRPILTVCSMDGGVIDAGSPPDVFVPVDMLGELGAFEGRPRVDP